MPLYRTSRDLPYWLPFRPDRFEEAIAQTWLSVRMVGRTCQNSVIIVDHEPCLGGIYMRFECRLERQGQLVPFKLSVLLCYPDCSSISPISG